MRSATRTTLPPWPPSPLAVGYEDDVAAVTAVAAVRTALGDKFFAAEAAHAVAAFSGLYKNSGSINKHISPH